MRKEEIKNTAVAEVHYVVPHDLLNSISARLDKIEANTAPRETYLRAEEVRRILKISHSGLYCLEKRGGITPCQLKGLKSVRYKASEVYALAQTRGIEIPDGNVQ